MKKIALTVLFVLLLTWSSFSQQSSTINTVNRPKRVPFKQEYLKQLKLPQGFKVEVFADKSWQSSNAAGAR
jgi:hypothetical protein